jgi:ABC-2 type transport system ATP-binding protein
MSSAPLTTVAATGAHRRADPECPMIQVSHLTKRFGPTVAVENVSFEVHRREVVGFLGPNGAGKTTTMRVLTCYLPADEGTATIADFDVGRQSLEVRKRIGYLPESAPLYSEMGVMGYLDFVGETRGLDPARRRRRIDQMIDVCGLSRVLKKDIVELSKGYRQRVGLAQTLIHDPDVGPDERLGPDPTRSSRSVS